MEALFLAYEKEVAKSIQPGAKHKVGLKLYTDSGPGLCTPHNLVRATILSLKKRGYLEKDIFILDQSEHKIRESKFLPPNSVGGNSFENVPIYALDSGRYFNPEWFYISPLPRKIFTVKLNPNDDDLNSMLPVTLFHDCDFWINLPMVSSHEATGVSGSVANATLFNISNADRYFDNPHHAQLAMAEIAAIPELRESLAFNILCLEDYQSVAGSMYNAHYCGSEPLIWLSTNMVALDYKMYEKINKLRKQQKLHPIEPMPPFLDYCKQLKIGDYNNLKIIRSYP